MMPYVELFNANAGMQSRRPEKNAKSPKSMEQIEAKGIQLYIKRNLTANIRLLLLKKCTDDYEEVMYYELNISNIQR